jgi:hypothetical protein
MSFPVPCTALARSFTRTPGSARSLAGICRLRTSEWELAILYQELAECVDVSRVLTSTSSDWQTYCRSGRLNHSHPIVMPAPAHDSAFARLKVIVLGFLLHMWNAVRNGSEIEPFEK